MAQQGWTTGPAPETSAWAPGPIPTTPTFRQTDTTPNEVDPNTLRTFASHVATQLNPIPAGQLLPFPKSLGGAGWDAPIQAGKHLLEAQGAVFDRAKEAYAKGDVASAAIHALHWLLPVIGPMLDKAGVELQQGKYAAGLGDTVGLAGSLAGPKVLRETVVPAVMSSKAGQAVATAAETGAVKRVVDVIAPKVGANKVRFGNAAANVAPAIARETTGLSRAAVAESVAAKLEDATAALDEAANTRLNAKSFPTKPVLDALQAKRDRLTSQAVQGSQFQPQSGVNRPPLGADVVPAPNAIRVAQIDQAMKEIRTLGPVARYEALRRIREAYDGPAKAVYSPAMTADYMTAQGGKMGAADVTGTLRDQLATLDPNTAAANAEYSLWKKASDVLTAAEETERVRPTVGRTLMARGLGAAAGGGIDGGLGAAVGAMIAPTVERLMAGASPAIKLVVARQMASMADALRAGDLGKFKALLSTVQKMAPAAITARTAAQQPAPTLTPALAGAGQR